MPIFSSETHCNFFLLFYPLSFSSYLYSLRHILSWKIVSYIYIFSFSLSLFLLIRFELVLLKYRVPRSHMSTHTGNMISTISICRPTFGDSRTIAMHTTGRPAARKNVLRRPFFPILTGCRWFNFFNPTFWHSKRIKNSITTKENSPPPIKQKKSLFCIHPMFVAHTHTTHTM